MAVNYTTFEDILDDVLFRAGENPDSSDFVEAAQRYILRAYDAICNGGTEFDFLLDIKWWWLRRTNTIEFNNQAGGLYDISADVNFLSERIYTDPENEDINNSYPWIELAPHDEVLSRRQAFKRNDNLQEFPLRFALVPDGLTTLPSILFDRDGDLDDGNIELTYNYIRTVNAQDWERTDEPLVPYKYRKTIADYALSFLYSDKTDSRAVSFQQITQNSLKAMKTEHNRVTQPLNSDFMRISIVNTNIVNVNTGIRSINPRNPYSAGYFRPGY